MNARRSSATVAVVSLGLLMGCAGDGPMPPPPGVTVSGSVRDRYGEPISGASVLIKGKSAVTSGSDGTFSIADVVTPYDLTVILRAQNTALVYKGLTRLDPSVFYPGATGAERTATISGTAPPASDRVTGVVFVSSAGYAFGAGPADATTGKYAFTVSWNGSGDTYAGQVYLLRWALDAARLPSSYDGYASKPLTIHAGGDFPGNDFAAVEVSDPAEQSISGTIAVPASYALKYRRMYVLFDGRGGLYWEEAAANATPNPLPSAFTYTVPALSGSQDIVEAWAFDKSFRALDGSGRWSSFFKTGISGNSVNISVPLATAQPLFSPVDGAVSLDTTTSFTWGQGEGAGVNLFRVTPGDPSNPTFLVFTAGTATKIPDLAGAGMSLPAGAGYSWEVVRTFPVMSMNDAASDGFRHLYNGESGDAGSTYSERFGFTTKTAAGTAFAASAAGPTAAVAEGADRRGLVMRAEAVAIAPR